MAGPGQVLYDQRRRLIRVVVTDPEHPQRPFAGQIDLVALPPIERRAPEGGRVGGEPSVCWSLKWYIRPPFPGPEAGKSLIGASGAPSGYTQPVAVRIFQVALPPSKTLFVDRVPNSSDTASMSLTYRWISVLGRASPLCSDR